VEAQIGINEVDTSNHTNQKQTNTVSNNLTCISTNTCRTQESDQRPTNLLMDENQAETAISSGNSEREKPIWPQMVSFNWKTGTVAQKSKLDRETEDTLKRKSSA
jgi:hypothetical protein